MTVYLDVILLENIIMNYIILLATGIISKTKINKIKLLLSSLIGGIYSVVTFTIKDQIIFGLIMKILLSIAMINIAFRPLSFKKLIKQISIFYLTSFAFGGCAFFLLYYIKPQDILMKNGVLIGTYPIKIAILGGIFGFIIINIVFKLVKGKLEKNNMFCNLEIEIEGKISKVIAMIDTGNLLKDPISNVPVIIVEKNKLNEIIEEDILENTKKIITAEKTDIPDKYMSKLKVIPFTSLGKQNGMLLGIKADKVKITLDDEQIEVDKAIIGIYEKQLTKDQKYCALIGLELIERKMIK